MPYITIPQNKVFQITFDDLLFGRDCVDEKEEKNTRTVFKDTIPEKILQNLDVTSLINVLKDFNAKYSNLIDIKDKKVLYSSFKIPKRSGGLRNIDAPNAELSEALRSLKYLFEYRFYASYHTTAFAYIKGRSTIDAVKRHQANGSRWFLKLDFHDFFGSTTLKFVLTQFSKIYPFSEVIKAKDGKEELEKALSLCFLNGGLPQGTPISPLLTNIMMIPIDHRLSRLARENESRLIYTRYADDMIISCKYDFDWKQIQEKVIRIVQDEKAPFSLNSSKTRYGSSSGRNWNLGVMLNKDNQITVGHKKKKQLKVMIFNFLQSYQNGVWWNVEDVQALSGIISYYLMVEKENIEKIIKDYERKFGVSLKDVFKEQITHPENAPAILVDKD